MMPKVIGNNSLIARINEVEGCMYRQSNELGRLNKAVKKYKDENAKLRRLVSGLNWCTENAKVPSAECEHCPLGDTEDGELSCEKLMRELGLEADDE